MPISIEGMFKGAKNRANRARMKMEADFGWVRTGFEDKEVGIFLGGFIVVVNKQGVWGYT